MDFRIITKGVASCWSVGDCDDDEDCMGPPAVSELGAFCSYHYTIIVCRLFPPRCPNDGLLLFSGPYYDHENVLFAVDTH